MRVYQWETGAFTKIELHMLSIMCIERLDKGLKPICVLSCSMRALEFGPIDEIRKKYGNLRRIEEIPKDSITNPAVVFKRKDEKKEIIPWDSDRALELWQKRHPDSGVPLSDVFTNKKDITQVPDGTIRSNRLVLKAKNVKELMFYTMDDE